MYPTKKLFEICLAINDGNYGNDYPKDNEFFEFGIPFITAKNIGENGLIKYHNLLFISKEKHATLKKAQITTGDILLVNRGAKDNLSNIATIVYDDIFTEANIGPQLTRVRVDANTVNNKYLFYYFYSNQFKHEFNKITNGAALKFISLTKTKEFIIPLPPLSTQSCIVARLDSAFASIDEQISLLRANITDVENMRKSFMAQSFEVGKYEMRKLSEVCNKITDGSHNPPKGIESGIPMISSRNLEDNNINFDNIRYISEEDYIIENKRTNVEEGDILLSIVGTIGKVCIVRSEFGPFTMQRSLSVLKINQEKVIPFFIYYYLNSDLVQKELNDGANGAAQKGIYLNQIKEIQIPLPSLHRQHEIVAHLDQVFATTEALRGEYEAQIGDLETLRQSLLEEAFAGRLVTD